MLIGIFLMIFACISGQQVPRNIKTQEYKDLQQRLCRGWNTWYNNSVMSHVLLPEGVAISLCISGEKNNYLKDIFKVSRLTGRTEEVILGLRSDNGSYTSMKLKWDKTEIEVQSATDGDDIVLLIRPLGPTIDKLVIEGGILWGHDGLTGKNGDIISCILPGRSIEIRTTAAIDEDAYVSSNVPSLITSLEKEVGVYTGKSKSIDDIKSIIEKRRLEQISRMNKYDNLAEAFHAMQTILSWNTIYDAPNNRVITPVSRWWNYNWKGFVMFDWDTYFASYMLSFFNKDLAYANAIEITKAITPSGFIPNFSSPYGYSSWDRSEPPVGSMIINMIYKKYGEKWFLQEVYDELLSWNRWWAKNRVIRGYLAWGSDPVADSSYKSDHEFLGAILESGLDNSPMYDNVPFNPKTNTMEIADVGLMSLYIMDCNSLAEISDALGKSAEAKELRNRGAHYKTILSTLWDEKSGIFLNKRTDTDEKSSRISPTNFYPMLAKACTQKQAERMIKEHYFNKNEFYGVYVLPSISRNDPGFKDNNYWRGRIWAPMNFLVYLGMRNYDLANARKDLVEKSSALLMKSWNKNGAIYENYNAVTGEGDDVQNADNFYHWGALLTFISFIERGFMDPDSVRK